MGPRCGPPGCNSRGTGRLDPKVWREATEALARVATTRAERELEAARQRAAKLKAAIERDVAAERTAVKEPEAVAPESAHVVKASHELKRWQHAAREGKF